MNLKEAFRYQNKLQALLDEAQGILDCDSSDECGQYLSAPQGHGRG